MWIFTPFGFFSIVQKPLDGQPDNPTLLQIRARRKEDLVALGRHMQAVGAIRKLPRIIGTPDADYPCRIIVERVVLRLTLASFADMVCYDNFKSEAQLVKRGGYRHPFVQFLHQVWTLGVRYETGKKTEVDQFSLL